MKMATATTKTLVFIIVLFCFQITNTKGISDDEARSKLKKYLPKFYFHSDECWFPRSLEDMTEINWDSAVPNDKDAHIPFTDKGESWRSDAKIYSAYRNLGYSIEEFTYTLFFPFNGCGGVLSFYIKLFGKKLYDGKYDLCPMGRHYVDKQIITVWTISGTPYKVQLSQHENYPVYEKSQFNWTGNHVHIYLGLGTHASYPKPGDTKYKSLFDVKKNKITKMHAALYDRPRDNGRVLYNENKIRLLKNQGVAVSGLTKAEVLYGFEYLGTMGSTVTNSKSLSSAVNVLNKAANKLGKVGLKGWKDKCKNAIDEIEGETTKEGSKALAANKLWKDK